MKNKNLNLDQPRTSKFYLTRILLIYFFSNYRRSLSILIYHKASLKCWYELPENTDLLISMTNCRYNGNHQFIVINKSLPHNGQIHSCIDSRNILTISLTELLVYEECPCSIALYKLITKCFDLCVQYKYSKHS